MLVKANSKVLKISFNDTVIKNKLSMLE